MKKEMNGGIETIHASVEAKLPSTDYELVPLIAKRFSARSFSNDMIEEKKLKELIEAARWAPSSMNEQPWRYAYAFRGTSGFDRIWETLNGGNQPWAAKASVLMLAYIKTTFTSNGVSNGAALHDLGLANAQLFVQATANDIYGHIMGGFDKEKAKEVFIMGEDTQPVLVIALGYLDEAAKLEEPFRTRETSPRSRKSLEEISRNIS